MDMVRRFDSAWFGRYEAKQIGRGNFGSKAGSQVEVPSEIEKLGHRVPKKLKFELKQRSSSVE